MQELWGEVVEEYLKKIGTNHKGTSPYHRHTNGKVERLNRILEGILSKLLFQTSTKSWASISTQHYSQISHAEFEWTKRPFYLLHGREPHLFGDSNRALSVDTLPANSAERIRLLQSAGQEAAIASYKWSRIEKGKQDDLVPHMLDKGDWVLVRQEGHNNFKSTWFGPYQIFQKVLLGTYHLQDPNGKEFGYLIHGNRLIKANVRSTNELRKL
jgi:hypothetical protein